MVILFSLLQSIALADFTIPITGTVKDKANRPLSGVRISDGVNQVFTNSSGEYSINEPVGGTFTLYSYKLGLDDASQSGTAFVGTTINFSLTYKIVPSVTPSAFNNDPARSIEIAVKSYAPATSCVTWTDDASGASQQLSVISAIAGGESTWGGTYAVPAGRPEGNYTHRAIAKECSSGSTLTKSPPVTGSFNVDNKSPVLYAYAPQNLGNCLAPCQRFDVIVQDANTGVDGSSARFTLRAADGSTVIDAVPMATLWSNSSYVGLSAAGPPLTDRQAYEAQVTVRDRAGNTLSRTYTFRVVSIRIDPTKVRVPEVSATLETIQNGTLAVFPAVTAILDHYPVTMSAAQHAGLGFAIQAVSFDSMTVTYESNGTTFTILASTLSSPDEQLPFRRREIEQPLAVYETHTESFDIAVPTQAGNLGRVRLALPAGVTSAKLSMPSVFTTTVPGLYPRLLTAPALNTANCPSSRVEDCLAAVDPTPVYSDPFAARGYASASADTARDGAKFALERGWVVFEAIPTDIIFALVCGRDASNHEQCTPVDDGYDEWPLDRPCTHPRLCNPGPVDDALTDPAGALTDPAALAAPPQRFTESDLRAKCGITLDCADPGAGLPGQTVAAGNSSCSGDPDINGLMTCKGGTHWMGYIQERSYGRPPNAQIACRGPVAGKECEFLWLGQKWGSRAHWHDTNNDYDDCPVALQSPCDGVHGAWGRAERNGGSYMLTELGQLGGYYVPRSFHESYLDPNEELCPDTGDDNPDPTIVVRHPWKKQSDDLEGRGYIYTNNVAPIHRESNMCVYWNSGGWIKGLYLINEPNYDAPSNGKAKQRYDEIRTGCGWFFQVDGASVSWPPGLNVKFRDPCSNRVYQRYYSNLPYKW